MSPRSTPRGASSGQVHSIAVVSARTGLSPDVLRVWERRYAAVAPTRSAGNQRLYSDEDIARFRLLAAATGRGRSIRNVAALPTVELQRIVDADDAASRTSDSATSRPAATGALEAAMALTTELDGAGLDRMLRRTIVQHGLSTFVEVDAPALMRRVGDDWAAGRLSVAQEHLASGVVITILLDAVRTMPTAESAPRLLVATLSSERHAVGVALAAAVAALEGWAIVHLGVDVPFTDIAAAAEATGVRAVALSVVHDHDRAHVLHEIAGVRKIASASIPVIVGGAAAVAMSASIGALGAIVCRNFSEFRATLAHEYMLASRNLP